MKYYLRKTLMTGVVFLACCVTTLCGLAQEKKGFVPRLEVPKARAVIEEMLAKSGVPKPARPPKLLVFWKCEGMAHVHAIEHAIALYQVAAKQGYCTVDFSGDYAALSATNLARYDALVMNNTTSLKLKEHPELERVLLEYVRGGKGYVALHGGADNFRDSPVLCTLLGGCFAGHPWTWKGGEWRFKIDDPQSPINASLGSQPFSFADEIYQHRNPYGSRTNIHVLVSMDLSDATTAAMNREKQCHKDTNDYPVSWTRTEGKGRVFYTSFGHDQAAYLHPKIMAHILLGTLYAGEVR